MALKRTLILITIILLLLISTPGEAAVVIHEPGTHYGNRHNAMRAAELLDGYVIEPGQVFSYNNAVGPRTPDKGFITGLAVSGGKTLYTVGGGVCRTSTAVYQAALEAGLPVIERYPHSFRVSYTAPGMDASVWWPSADLKFRNNTRTPLIVRARATLEKVEIVLVPMIQIHHRDRLVGFGWLEDGRTVVFLRRMAEALGGTVEWQQGTAYVNGLAVPEGICRVDRGTHVVPLRDLANLMGMHVKWQSDRVILEEIPSHYAQGVSHEIRGENEPLPFIDPIDQPDCEL